MRYRGISADGHINEPPSLWVDNLPEKFKERGPRVIETRTTKGHGVGFMENELMWHYRSLREEDRARVLAEVDRAAA